MPMNFIVRTRLCNHVPVSLSLISMSLYFIWVLTLCLVFSKEIQSNTEILQPFNHLRIPPCTFCLSRCFVTLTCRNEFIPSSPPTLTLPDKWGPLATLPLLMEVIPLGPYMDQLSQITHQIWSSQPSSVMLRILDVSLESSDVEWQGLGGLLVTSFRFIGCKIRRLFLYRMFPLLYVISSCQNHSELAATALTL